MGKTLLILEDDDALRKLLVKFFTTQSFDVNEARSGPEAIAVASRKKLDLFLTDVRMEGMDGLECLAALRQAQPGLKSIVMTGYASPDAPTRAMRLGADDYIYKPFQVKQLLVIVKRVLEKGREKEGYLGMLRGLLPQNARLERPWEELRDLSYQSFYVGVRSRKLGREEALSIWDELEKLVREESTHPDLAQAYQCQIDRMAALSRADMFVPRPSPGGVEPERFARFYQRVRDGEVNQEQVAVAAPLRLLPEQSRAQALMLEELYRHIWG